MCTLSRAYCIPALRVLVTKTGDESLTSVRTYLKLSNAYIAFQF
jgi:hypothetical protein